MRFFLCISHLKITWTLFCKIKSWCILIVSNLFRYVPIWLIYRVAFSKFYSYILLSFCQCSFGFEINLVDLYSWNRRIYKFICSAMNSHWAFTSALVFYCNMSQMIMEELTWSCIRESTEAMNQTNIFLLLTPKKSN